MYGIKFHFYPYFHRLLRVELIFVLFCVKKLRKEHNQKLQNVTCINTI